jgi:hypothetical protein
MPKLFDLYLGDRFPVTQKELILKQVNGAFVKGKAKGVIAEECFQNLIHSYHAEGLSCGRSIRSILLDEAVFCFNAGFVEGSKELIAILVALYHSIEYINEQLWYGDRVSLDGISVHDRVLLLTIATALGVITLPEIDICSERHIYTSIDRIKIERKETRNKSKG